MKLNKSNSPATWLLTTPYGNLVFATILLFIANYFHIFELKILLSDDQTRVLEAHKSSFPFWPESKRIVLHPLNTYIFQIPFFELLKSSTVAARFVLLITCAIPVTLLLTLFLNLVFSVPRKKAILCAILPFLFLREHQLIGFINGSYVISGMVFVLSSLLFAFKYNQSYRFKNALLSSVFYLLAVAHFDHAVFFTPLILLVSRLDLKTDSFQLRSRLKQFLPFAFGIISISLAKLLHMKLHPRGAYNRPDLTLSLVSDRVWNSLKWLNPFSGVIDHPVFDVILLTFVLISSYLLFFQFKKEKKTLLYFFVLWFICNYLPFMTVAKYNSSRHFLISNISVAVLFVLGSSFLVAKFSRISSHIKYWTTIFLIAALAFSKNNLIGKAHNKSNSTFIRVQAETKHLNPPPDSQFVILGPKSIPSGGYFHWSTGYINHLFNRFDLSGVTPFEYNFYDPFLSIGKSYGYRMSGLKIEKPTFILKFDKDLNPYQFKYFLRWRYYTTINQTPHLIRDKEKSIQQEEATNTWEVYDVTKSSKIPQLVAQGKDLQEYRSFLNKYNIEPSEVAFGDLSKGLTKNKTP